MTASPHFALTIERADLLAALAPAAKVIERRNTIPILGNVLLEAAPGGLTITGTDLDIWIRTGAPARCEEHGAITVQASVFHDIVRRMAEGAEIAFTCAGAGMATVKAGRSRFNLPTLPAQDFPDLTAATFPTEFRMPAQALGALFGAVEFAISTEETRYYLNGIYLHAHDRDGAAALRAVATDGHRLARADTARFSGAIAGMRGVIVPRKAVAELRRLVDGQGEAEIALGVSESKLEARIGSTTLCTKLIDGTYPDYQRVIPAGNDKTLRLATADLAAGVARVMAIATERGRAVRLTCAAERLALLCRSPDAGDAEDEVEAEYAGPEGFEIGFSGRYLAEILTQIGDAAHIRFGDPTSPALIQAREGADALYVLMPMRVA